MSKPTISGWTPAVDNDRTEANLSQLPSEPKNVFYFRPASPTKDASTSRNSSITVDHNATGASSPASSSSSLRPETPGDLDDDADSVPRKGDPDWVPRPPNAFIIFRREYSTTNNREAAESRGLYVPPHKEKSLSKRAGEAWAELSAEERQVYEDRAKHAKDEHAKEHPNYKFRPQKMKRSRSSKGKKTRSPISRPSSARRKSPASPRLHYRARSADSEAGPSRRRIAMPPPPPLSAASIKAIRRRSPSVSFLPIPTALSQNDDDPPRPKIKRRSQSLTDFNWMNAGPISGPLIQFADDSDMAFHDVDISNESLSYPTPEEAGPPHYNAEAQGHEVHQSQPQFTINSNFPGSYMSPLNAVASSLENWNGGMVHQPTPVVPSQSHASVLYGSAPMIQYQYAPSIEQVSAQHYSPPPMPPTISTDVLWSGQPESQSHQYMSSLSSVSVGVEQDESTEAEQAYALQEYDHGLAQRTSSSNPFEENLWPSTYNQLNGDIFYDYNANSTIIE